MPDDSGPIRPKAPPMPVSLEDLDKLRKFQKRTSLNDIVERIHRALYNNPEYQKYLTAIWPEETIQGSFQCDDVAAAQMIQKYASDNNIVIPPSSNKWSAIIKSLHVVQGYYNDQTRRARRKLVMKLDDDTEE